MSSLQITLAAAAAVLFFWAVGVYNRLMELRNAILRRFGHFDEQFKLRHALLLRHLDAHVAMPTEAPVGHAAPQALLALRAACLQTLSACDAARTQPAVAETVISLRLAESILQGAIDRLQRMDSDQSGPGGLTGPLSASESALQFARSQFNDSVRAYNLAVRQFPTCLLAGMLGFRAAGHL